MACRGPRGQGVTAGRNVLAPILASKRAEIDALRGAALPPPRETPRGALVRERLTRAEGAPLRLVTEIKHKSPSAGPLSTALSPAERGRAYAESGATMISVLCDGPFFDGAWEHVEAVRAAVGDRALVLAKEFVLDEIQIARAARAGADAVLVIVRIVDREKTRALVAAARALGVEPLVEIVTEEELAIALDAKATVIGVNARDLDTLVMDAARAARVLAAIPEGCVPVHLSGLRGPEDVRGVARSDAHAALLGEALMREDDPRELLSRMIREADVPRPAR